MQLVTPTASRGGGGGGRTRNLGERYAASWKDTIWKTRDVSRRFTLRSIRTGQWNRFCTNLMHFHSQPVYVYGTSCWDSISFIFCCLSCVCVCVLVSAPCSSFVISVCMLRCLFLATWLLTQHTTNKRTDLNDWIIIIIIIIIVIIIMALLFWQTVVETLHNWPCGCKETSNIVTSPHGQSVR